MIGSSFPGRSAPAPLPHVSAARARYWFAGIAFGTLVCAAAACGDGDGLAAKPPAANEVADPRMGQPCTPDTTEECHLTVGENGDVLTCLDGERRCVDSTWGPCEGGFSATPAPDPEAQAAPTDGPGAQPLSTGTASPCPNNPCDPKCQQYTESGGVVLTPTQSGTYYEGSLQDAIALSPAGFIDKGMKKPCSTTSDCQFDYHCVANGTNGNSCGTGVAKCCTAWKAGEIDSTCSKPDATSGFACTLNGTPTVPVCNRGNAILPKGTAVYVFPGNSTQFPTCTPDNNPGVCYTTADVKPGACTNVTGCPGLTGNGTKTLMVNPPKTPASGTPNPAWKDECTCTNNWGVWSGNAAPCQIKPNWDTAPTTYKDTYTAACPTGMQPQWQYLTYEAITPSDSRITFQAHAANTLADLAVQPLQPVGTAKALPLPDTQNCTLLGPSPSCPLNLFSSLGLQRYGKMLELSITLNPSSDKQYGATLKNWKVSFTCVWGE